MVDLGFLLITFFVFTSELSRPNTLDLLMPKEGKDMPVAESLSLTILVGGEGQVFYYEGEWSASKVMSTSFHVVTGMGKVIRDKQKQLDMHPVRGEGRAGLMLLIKPGDTIDELENLCDRVQPFAVIMGAKGSSGIESIFGSTTLSAIRRLKWPVISVPPGKEYGVGIRKIGFACDFRDVVETTPAGAIKEVARQFNAEFHILNVSPENSDKGAGPKPDFDLLKTMFQEINPVYDFISHADIDEGINEFAEKNNLDLVITIPKKHKLMEGIFKKRSTKKLLFHSHIPIMCVHED